MTVQDRFIALIRTVIPYLWSAAIAFLVGRFPVVQDVITWLNEFSGQDVTAAIGLFLVGLVLAGYYWLARWAGARWPILERWLMGRSVVPVYGSDVYIIPKPSPEAEERARHL